MLWPKTVGNSHVIVRLYFHLMTEPTAAAATCCYSRLITRKCSPVATTPFKSASTLAKSLRPGKPIGSNAARGQLRVLGKSLWFDKVLGRSESYLPHKVVTVIGELRVLVYRMMNGGKTNVLFLLWRGVSERPCLL